MPDLQVSLKFLIDLSLNNDKVWFNANKDYYHKAYNEFAEFIDLLIPEIKKIDNNVNVTSSKQCLFRIYRDVRFSHDKNPYKTNFGAYIVKDGKKSPYAGYYLHMEPDNSFIGGGIYMPQNEILKNIRVYILKNAEKFRGIIYDPVFIDVFGELMDHKLKSAPRGFAKDHPDLDLILHKSYAVGHMLSDNSWHDPDLIDRIIKVFKIQYKLNSFLNNAL
jgi:uncharacterized protein (TIGR02453 family)